jgi:hypothetical protein
MTYSNLLDLDRFFYNVREQIYVAIKLGDFPNYYKGSDIDIFCYHKEEFAKAIITVGNQYLEQGFEVRVADKESLQTHVDFYLDGELEIRFDLYQALPHYKKIRIKEHYIFSVIENASIMSRVFEGIQYPLYIPSIVDELLLRYIEYIEWYELRPDKIKHLNYILEAVSDDSSRIGFLDKLHLYTELPAPHFERTWIQRSYWLRRLVSWVKKARSIPLYCIPGVLFGKLRKAVLPPSKNNQSSE